MQQTPHLYNVTIKDSDWANPISLAAIKGISIDFFSPFYSDVSFQRFRVPNNKIWNFRDPKGSLKGSPIRASSDQRSHAPTWGISQLDTPFIATQAYPSTKWRLRVVRSFYTITQLYMTIIVACTTTSFTLQYLKSCIYQYKLFNNLSRTALH